jgi:hypothetical protein
MFKDFSEYADENEIKSSVAYQAHLHGELVAYILHLNKFINLVDLERMYNLHQTHSLGTFQNNLIVTRTPDELNNLINMKENSRTMSYRSNQYDSHEKHMTLTYQRKEPLYDAHHTTQRIINNLMVEVCKKETYIDHVQNYSAENLAKDRIKDAVLDMNLHLYRTLHSSNLYNLKYRTQTDERYADKNSVGFVKQVRKVEPLRIDPEIVIDANWCDKVFDTNRAILEYQGARTFTLTLDLLSENSRMKMFKSKQLQIKGTREQTNTANSYFNSGTWKNIGPLFKVHDLFFCVSKGVGKEYWALGSDEKKAESVMRRRQKLEMLRTLNV